MDTAQNTAQNNAAELLSLIDPTLTNASLADAARTTESIDTVKFAFNPWCEIFNISLQGFKLGIQHPILRRLQLIPLRAWKVAKIIPRASGFTVGSITTAGAFPGGGVGSQNQPELQYPSVSAENFLIAWGDQGQNDVGCRILESLTARSDQEKVEALAIFRAVMESGAVPGSSLPLERLPQFLRLDAKQLLRIGLEKGVNFGTERDPRIVQLGMTSMRKGGQMIDEIGDAVRAANVAGLKILEATKADLADAKIGVKDVKRKLDQLDKWLLGQFPSFSLDSEVERAAQATAPLSQAISDSSVQNQQTIEQMMEMNRQTLEQLRIANENNAALMREVIAARQQPTAPPTQQPSA